MYFMQIIVCSEHVKFRGNIKVIGVHLLIRKVGKGGAGLS